MSIRRTVVSKDGHVTIELPDELRGKRVVVTVKEVTNGRAAKARLMREAANDPRIQRDIREIGEDFAYADSEI